MTMNKMRSLALLGIGWSSLALAVNGCGGSTTSAVATTSTDENPIIGGVDAKSSSLNAIGSLVEVYTYTYCTSRVCSEPLAAVSKPTSPSKRLDRPRIQRVADSGAGGAPNTPDTPPAPPPPAGRGGSSAISSSGGTTTITEYWPFCSAALIGPHTVVTAKHCVQDMDYMGDVAFAVGPDATNPIAVYPIVDFDMESTVPPDTYSLFSDLGSDVGVVYLDKAVTDLTPLALGTLQESDIGTRFAAVGYGDQDNREVSGTRKVGSLTLRGIGGNYVDYAFGGLDAFLAMGATLPDFQGSDESYLRYIYERMTLLSDYQAFLGGKPGDAQPCYGDSGGPLVAMRNGVRTTFGLVTSGMPSSRLICDWGGVFAVFGPATLNFLQQSLAWVDPCIGYTVAGKCEGPTAVRCTNRTEGKRRVVRTDCDLLGQTCGIDSAGNAACVDP